MMADDQVDRSIEGPARGDRGSAAMVGDQEEPHTAMDSTLTSSYPFD